jgi:hypothetical protein
VEVNSTTKLESDVVSGYEYSSWWWLGVAQELQLRPVVVILSCFDSVDLFKASVGDDCLIILESNLSASLGSSLKGMARLGLEDGRITSCLCGLSDQIGLERLVGTRMLRQPVKGWTQDT